MDMNENIEAIQNIDLNDVWQGKNFGVEENVKIKICNIRPCRDLDPDHRLRKPVFYPSYTTGALFNNISQYYYITFTYN